MSYQSYVVISCSKVSRIKSHFVSSQNVLCIDWSGISLTVYGVSSSSSSSSDKETSRRNGSQQGQARLKTCKRSNIALIPTTFYCYSRRSQGRSPHLWLLNDRGGYNVIRPRQFPRPAAASEWLTTTKKKNTHTVFSPSVLTPHLNLSSNDSCPDSLSAVMLPVTEINMQNHALRITQLLSNIASAH